MTITSEELDKSQAICDEATDGPWISWRFRLAWPLTVLAGDFTIANFDDELPPSDDELPPSEQSRNAAFIAPARTALPQYIAEIRRLREDVSRLKTLCYELAGPDAKPLTIEDVGDCR